tara:strand:- start:4547 stop:4951 length:405 start_codon:yes stop_codon:yes gene_type:complete
MNRKKCLETIQLLARLSAADENGYVQCVSCGTVKHYKDGMQGGHFIAKGISSFWALEICNVHPQCLGCNMFGMKSGAAAQEYTLWMQEMYGLHFVEEMLHNRKNPIKFYKKDYEEMYKEWNELIKHHRNRIGEC